MVVRTCRVSSWDAQGVEHTVQVTAQSLHKAVAQALRVFREDEWSEDPNRGPATVVVTINQPQVEHRVRIKDFQNWLDSVGRVPPRWRSSGAWVDATEQTIAAAANSQVDQMPSDLQQSITDAPGTSAYPICSYSYLLFFKQQADQAKVASFSKFMSWVLHEGQSFAGRLHYAPLPEKVAERSDAQLKQINVATVNTALSCKARLGIATHRATLFPITKDENAGYLGSD